MHGSLSGSGTGSNHGTSQGSRRDIDSLALGSILGKQPYQWKTFTTFLTIFLSLDQGIWRGGKRSQRLKNLNTGKIAQLKPLLKTSTQSQAYETEIL